MRLARSSLRRFEVDSFTLGSTSAEEFVVVQIFAFPELSQQDVEGTDVA